MDLMRRGIAPLRLVLVLTFGVLVVFQFLSFPGQFAHMARENPHDASLRWPLTAYTAVLILCAEVVVACTWKLAGMVRQDRIFTTAAMRWVDVIIGAVTVVWVLLAAAFAYVGSHADDPGLPMLLLLLLLVASAIGLLMPVMRSLLAQATRLRVDLEALR
jgi:hypothetical protein